MWLNDLQSSTCWIWYLQSLAGFFTWGKTTQWLIKCGIQTFKSIFQSGQIPDEISTMIVACQTPKINNTQDQLSYCSSISNYHWWQYIRCDSTKSESGIHVRLMDSPFISPLLWNKLMQYWKLKYIPESPKKPQIDVFLLYRWIWSPQVIN